MRFVPKDLDASFEVEVVRGTDHPAVFRLIVGSADCDSSQIPFAESRIGQPLAVVSRILRTFPQRPIASRHDHSSRSAGSISETNSVESLANFDKSRERFELAVKRHYPELGLEAARYREKNRIIARLRWQKLYMEDGSSRVFCGSSMPVNAPWSIVAIYSCRLTCTTMLRCFFADCAWFGAGRPGGMEASDVLSWLGRSKLLSPHLPHGVCLSWLVRRCVGSSFQCV